RASGSHPTGPYREPSWYSTVTLSRTARKKLEPAKSKDGERCIDPSEVVHRFAPAAAKGRRSPARAVRTPYTHRCSCRERVAGSTRSTPEPGAATTSIGSVWTWPRRQGNVVLIRNMKPT